MERWSLTLPWECRHGYYLVEPHSGRKVALALA